ncbi:epoxide hydrolase N-terminal domain-containing protein [Thermocrispum sp.]|jgi:hypothetical protein|uniref:epoxide hydrolase N-terminal domain-containing protein n=1 Tax=Thermocrispum sp. TaxID=2060768 RepID=UPI002579D3E8|nr:epoxide hydrolase N-terminal domain-containing protein [Thermocrispum sp.]
MTSTVRFFVPDVSDKYIDDLRARLSRVRWPEATTEPGWAQGPRWEEMQRLVGY